METKQKNQCLKERKVEEPYEVWKTADGSWEWRVLKKWQVDDDKLYARWFCAVKSPYTFGRFEYGDVYVKEIKENAFKQEQEKGKIIFKQEGIIKTYTCTCGAGTCEPDDEGVTCENCGARASWEDKK